MKAMPVELEDTNDEIIKIDTASQEAWDDVCEQFDHDVHRIRDVTGHDPYTALYACYDEENKPTYYLVEEDIKLSKIRRRVFLTKLGRTK